MIDYREISDGLELDAIKNLLEKMKIPYREVDNALIMQTVCHNEDLDSASWKLYYYKDTHIFYCYTECGAMSIFKFLKNFYEARGIQYDWFQDIYQVILDCSNYNSDQFLQNRYNSVRDKYKIEDAPEIPTCNPVVLECFTKYYTNEWLKDGITKEAMDKYNILYSISRNKIIIPHYNAQGELIGIRGRALEEEEITEYGKYMPVCVEGKWYAHPLGLNLYGLNVNKENIKREGYALLYEAEKSVMQHESFSFPNCAVATCGSNLNKFQIKLLIKECQPKEIILCYDREEIGKSDIYFNKLKSMCEKYKNYCNISFIYDMNGITKMKDSPSDNGEEVFRNLLEKRVRVK